MKSFLVEVAAALCAKDHDREKTMKTALLVIGVPLAILLRGWVLQSYWGWFFVPLGAPAISFWHALGAAALFSYLAHRPPDGKGELLRDAQCERLKISDTGAGVYLLAYVVVSSLAMLGFGWIFQALM